MYYISIYTQNDKNKRLNYRIIHSIYISIIFSTMCHVVPWFYP